MLTFSNSAGITDSRLTTHGAIQTQRLASYLVDHRGLAFTHIFSSDLIRARLTADAILDAQTREKSKGIIKPERIMLEILREQDFGSFERQPWASGLVKGLDGKAIDVGHPDFKPKETHESMIKRMEIFLDDFVHPVLAAETVDSGLESTVAVVSHGIILSVLWRTIIQRFGPRSISLGPEVGAVGGERLIEYLPGWSNTGYLELDIKPAPLSNGFDVLPPVDSALPVPKLNGYQMLIKTVNGKNHLNNLKRTRGGVGSSTFDEKQKSLEGFLKKPKRDEQNQRPG